MSFWEVLASQLTLLSIMGHLSFGLTAVSLAMRDMLLIRALGGASGLVGVALQQVLVRWGLRTWPSKAMRLLADLLGVRAG